MMDGTPCVQYQRLSSDSWESLVPSSSPISYALLFLFFFVFNTHTHIYSHWYIGRCVWNCKEWSWSCVDGTFFFFNIRARVVVIFLISRSYSRISKLYVGCISTRCSHEKYRCCDYGWSSRNLRFDYCCGVV